MIDRAATHPLRHTWWIFSAALVSLLVSAGSVWATTIDFEQFSPAPNTCNPKVLRVGVARFANGQPATSVPGALDQTTAYWNSTACGEVTRMVIEFSVPVSDVHFLLENLERGRPTTTYVVHSATVNNGLHTDLVVLPAPCTTIRCPPLSSTMVALPYTEIHAIDIQPLSVPDSDFLIDDVTFALPRGLLATWTRLCVLSSSPACPVLQALLLRLGLPLPTETATPTQTSIPTTPTETPTDTPSSCGSSGEQCCPPAAGPPCLVGTCDPASDRCP